MKVFWSVYSEAYLGFTQKKKVFLGIFSIFHYSQVLLECNPRQCLGITIQQCRDSAVVTDCCDYSVLIVLFVFF